MSLSQQYFSKSATTNTDQAQLLKQIRLLIIFMIFGLLVSGITAIPLMWEVSLLHALIGPGSHIQQLWPAMSDWIAQVYQALHMLEQHYPMLFYGTDWLAFAHIVIAIAFIGPYRDPVRNIWVIEFGLIACALVIPMALIFGPLRGIPFFWQLIDCSFGVLDSIPLWIARRMIIHLTLAIPA